MLPLEGFTVLQTVLVLGIAWFTTSVIMVEWNRVNKPVATGEGPSFSACEESDSWRFLGPKDDPWDFLEKTNFCVDYKTLGMDFIDHSDLHNST